MFNNQKRFMKKFILAICASLLIVEGCFAQVIESDYKKVFVCDVLSIDLDQDGEIGPYESFADKCYVTIDYRDYGLAGSLMEISVLTREEDGSTESFGNNFEDVILLNTPAGTNGNDLWSLCCADSLGDMLFMILDVPDDEGGYFRMLFINNLAILS